jgi:hypothetical protein
MKKMNKWSPGALEPWADKKKKKKVSNMDPWALGNLMEHKLL